MVTRVGRLSDARRSCGIADAASRSSSMSSVTAEIAGRTTSAAARVTFPEPST
jgi:hypothetical protein